MSAIVAMLAVKSGLTKEESEKFLKEFFGLLTDSLCEGENVKIKALGTFKVVSVEERRSVDVSTGEDILIPEHKKIVFVPSRELADEVNAPFSMFESVELNPEAENEIEDSIIEEESIFEISPEEESSEAEAIVEHEESAAIKEEVRESEKYEISEDNTHLSDPECKSEDSGSEESKDEETAAVETNISESEPEEAAPEIPHSSQDAQDSGNSEDSEAVDDYVENNEVEKEEFAEAESDSSEEGKRSAKSRYKFIIGFICGISAAILICLGGYYFFLKDKLLWQVSPQKEMASVDSVSKKATSDVTENKGIKPVASDSIAKESDGNEDEENVADTKPSDEIVYDTIGDHRYLTTMAKDHYGNFNLWPYIYEENKSFIGHPDRIKPGTRVVVPPLSKYGVDPKNPEDIKKAKRLGVSIYARYK